MLRAVARNDRVFSCLLGISQPGSNPSISIPCVSSITEGPTCSWKSLGNWTDITTFDFDFEIFKSMKFFFLWASNLCQFLTEFILLPANLFVYIVGAIAFSILYDDCESDAIVHRSETFYGSEFRSESEIRTKRFRSESRDEKRKRRK